MSDAQSNIEGSVMQEPGSNSSATEKKWPRPLLILFVIFAGLVTIVFLCQKESSINWTEDYQAGIKLAKQQSKPVLLAFYKRHTRFCSDMTQNTYNNQDVIRYVEENFVPILIDVDKQPEIAKQYNVQYYPTHYVKYPDSNELVGPQMGYDVPQVFIRILKGFLEKMDLPDK